jgi:hypothetical protein
VKASSPQHGSAPDACTLRARHVRPRRRTDHTHAESCADRAIHIHTLRESIERDLCELRARERVVVGIDWAAS